MILLNALEEFAEPRNSPDRRLLLSTLISVYKFATPPRWTDIERLCQEREEVWPDAFSKLETGMIFFWSRDDYERAAVKLREAIEFGRRQNKEHDTIIVYQALSTLGHALLRLGRQSEAIEVLGEIEAMVPGRVVVGDETGFLETLLKQGLVLDRVAKLASILAPVSRDPAFRKRLAKVAKQAAERARRPLPR